MAQDLVIPVSSDWNSSAWMNASLYLKDYPRSLENSDEFWSEVASRLTWIKPWTQVKDVSFGDPVRIEWFKGGKLNVAYNCIDRHLPHCKDRVAFYWEPEGEKSWSGYGLSAWQSDGKPSLALDVFKEN